MTSTCDFSIGSKHKSIGWNFLRLAFNSFLLYVQVRPHCAVHSSTSNSILCERIHIDLAYNTIPMAVVMPWCFGCDSYMAAAIYCCSKHAALAAIVIQSNLLRTDSSIISQVWAWAWQLDKHKSLLCVYWVCLQCTINNHLWHDPFEVQEAIWVCLCLLASSGVNSEIVDSLFCLVVYSVVELFIVPPT